MEEKEFSALIEDNQGIIWKVCRSFTNNDMDAEDLFQEIVLQLWKSHKSFKGDSKFTTWMYRVSLNTAVTLRRKSERMKTSDEIKEVHLKVEENNEFQEKQESVDRLYRAIYQLNDIEKALTLLYLEDMPYKVISETLGISEVNARVKMNRIKSKLKELMSNE